jgi:hypothetical protein
VSQSCEFCCHNPLWCFSRSVCCCCCLFRYNSVRQLLDTTSYLPKIHSNIILPCTQRSAEWSLPFRFPIKIFYALLTFPMRAICFAHLIVLDIMIQTPPGVTEFVKWIRYGLEGQGSIRCREWGEISVRHCAQTGSGAHQASLCNGYGRVKRPKHEDDLSNNADVKNAWSYTSSPPYVFMA